MIALNILSPIRSFGQTATNNFCFSTHEMDYWISCAYDATNYKKVIDSLRIEINNNRTMLKGDSVLIFDAVEMKNAKNKTIDAEEKLASEYKTESENKDKKIKAWKYVAAGAWLFEIGKSTFDLIKK